MLLGPLPMLICIPLKSSFACRSINTYVAQSLGGHGSSQFLPKAQAALPLASWHDMKVVDISAFAFQASRVAAILVTFSRRLPLPLHAVHTGCICWFLQM